MTDEFWICRDDVGIKCFPRVGSTTILQSYGYGQSCVGFMTAKRKHVVVRNPYERLLSAYALFQNKRYGDVPKIPDLNTLLEYILSHKDEDRDVHVRSMTCQLQGYEPAEKDIYDLKFFLANPVLNIGPVAARLHRNETYNRPDTGEIDNDMLGEYLEQYLPDTKLWKSARTQ